MPRKGQRLSRTTNRYSYNVRASKRNDTYKFLKEGIRNSNRSTGTRRRSSGGSRRKGKNIKINLTDEQSAQLLKVLLCVYAIFFLVIVIGILV